MAAELQRKPAGAAYRTGARVFTVLPRPEEVGTERLVQRIQDLRDRQVAYVVDFRDEAFPELPEQLAPFDAPRGDVVELLLQVRREVVLNVALEEARQEGRDDASPVFRNEAAVLQPHVIPVLQHLYDGGVGRGAADAELFQAFDEARLREAGWRLREVLFRRDLADGHRLAFRHARQHAAVFLLVFGGVVLAFLIELQEPVENHHGAGRSEDGTTVGGGDVYRDLIQPRAFHLRGEGALPDQLVEPEFILPEVALYLLRSPEEIRRADRFVGLLRVSSRIPKAARRFREVFGSVVRRDQPTAGSDRLARQVDAVGSHVGDEAGGLAADLDAFVEALRNPHRVAGTEAKLARGFLLQRRGGEGRLRIP